jgi:hypothetical protein
MSTLFPDQTGLNRICPLPGPKTTRMLVCTLCFEFRVTNKILSSNIYVKQR